MSTSRERFHAVRRFTPGTEPPHWETLGFWAPTRERWISEGLPADVDPLEAFGIEPRPRPSVDFGFTRIAYEPMFEEDILEDGEKTVIWRDPFGVVSRRLKEGEGVSMPQWLSFPVTCRRDWEQLKWRLDPDTPARYEVDWEAERRALEETQAPVGIYPCGAYGFLRNLFGEEKLAYMFYDDPSLIDDILEHWLHMLRKMFSEVITRVPVDYIYIWEDMAYKTAPLISPDCFRRFMLQRYSDLIGHVRALGVECFMLDSDGNCDALLPLFIEAGVNFFMPCEIAADMEPQALRDRYGDGLALWGGIDKRELSKGPAEIEAEVMRKVPALLAQGGFIPGLDHSTPPDIPFENFRLFINLLRSLYGSHTGT